MRKSFATAIAPLINASLQWLETITDSHRGSLETPDFIDAQVTLKRHFSEARRHLESQNREGWILVHYAIVAWVDEQCMALPWEGQKWWQNNSLELNYFQQTEGNREFYVHAEKAIRNRERDAIEIYFLCVALGFRGFYMDLRSENPEYVGYAKKFITRKQLPEDIRAWMRRTADQIPLGQSKTSSSEIAQLEASGAAPLNATTSFVSSLLFAMIGLGCLAAYGLFKWL